MHLGLDAASAVISAPSSPDRTSRVFFDARRASLRTTAPAVFGFHGFALLRGRTMAWAHRSSMASRHISGSNQTVSEPRHLRAFAAAIRGLRAGKRFGRPCPGSQIARRLEARPSRRRPGACGYRAAPSSMFCAAGPCRPSSAVSARGHATCLHRGVGPARSRRPARQRPCHHSRAGREARYPPQTPLGPAGTPGEYGEPFRLSGKSAGQSLLIQCSA